jgi:dephospho-CoA kinase
VHLDADAIARQVVAAGTPGLASVAEAFGPAVLTDDGSLDRAALAKLVFDNPELRQRLESIVHPLVQAETRRLLEHQPEDALVVYNVPLLVEANVSLPFDRIVTVEAPVDEQIKRMMAIRGMTLEEAQSRIRNQASPAQRANAAEFILSSNQSLELLLKDAGKLWLQFEREAEAKRRSNTGDKAENGGEGSN